MKKLLTAAALTLSLAAYAQADTPMLGNDTDYGIQSANKARVELFGADIAENTILRKTQHGYATADGKIRLQKSKRGWKLHQAK